MLNGKFTVVVLLVLLVAVSAGNYFKVPPDPMVLGAILLALKSDDIIKRKPQEPDGNGNK